MKTDRLEKIRATRALMDAQAIAEENRKNNEVKRYTDAIKALKDRINEMIVLADAMVENKISFGGDYVSNGLRFGDNFEIDGIDHRLGFVFEYQTGRGRDINYRLRTLGIGIEGGGYDGYDILIDRNGDIIKNPLKYAIGLRAKEDAYHDFCNKAKRVLQAFDGFEQKFYNYIDNL
jgi:hypothetical protein